MAACTPSVSQHPMREGTGNATESSMPYNRRAMSKMMLIRVHSECIVLVRVPAAGGAGRQPPVRGPG